MANCQAGVFVVYAGAGGATLVHRRLFLTEAWAGDEAYAERRQRCGVPEEALAFRTKPQLVLEMLTELVAEGSLPARWVSCDEGYGRSVDFLDGVAALGLGYMVEVPVDTRVWPEWPPTVVPRTRVRLVPGAPASMEARAAQLPAADPVRVFLCHAPRRITPARLAHLTGACWAIETCFREGKLLLGLGSCEGRSWHGWYRHMTLCLLLHFFLLLGRPGPQTTARPDAVLALFRNLRWDGSALLAAVLDRLQGRAARNAAATGSNARRRWVEQPP